VRAARPGLPSAPSAAGAETISAVEKHRLSATHRPRAGTRARYAGSVPGSTRRPRAGTRARHAAAAPGLHSRVHGPRREPGRRHERSSFVFPFDLRIVSPSVSCPGRRGGQSLRARAGAIRPRNAKYGYRAGSRQAPSRFGATSAPVLSHYPKPANRIQSLRGPLLLCALLARAFPAPPVRPGPKQSRLWRNTGSQPRTARGPAPVPGTPDPFPVPPAAPGPAPVPGTPQPPRGSTAGFVVRDGGPAGATSVRRSSSPSSFVFPFVLRLPLRPSYRLSRCAGFCLRRSERGGSGIEVSLLRRQASPRPRDRLVQFGLQSLPRWQHGEVLGDVDAAAIEFQ